MKKINCPKVGSFLEIPSLGMFKVSRVFPGHNRIVLQAVGNGLCRMIKVFGETVEIASDQAVGFISDIYEYRRQLESLGVRVPPLESIQVFSYRNNVSGRLNITEISPFYGESFEDMFLNAPDAKESLSLQRRMLKCLGGLFEKSPGDFLSVGIDLIPRNFTGDGQDWYVDLVPPKLRKGEKFQLEIPEVTEPNCYRVGVDRHYKKSGVVRVLLVQLAKLRPEMYPVFARGIEEFLALKGENKTLKSFRSRPIAKKPEKIINKKNISEMSFMDIYDLREIACWSAGQGKISPDELENFFRLSHFQSEPLPEKALKELRQILIHALC